MKKLNKIIINIFILLVTCCLLLVVAPTAQASALSLSIDPPIIIINAIPPTNVTSSLSIRNKSDTQITLQAQLQPFKAKGENGELEYFKETLEIFKNIQIMDSDVPVENITLGPKQQKNLNINISIPQDINISARPPASSLAGEVGRDYYFSIVFTSVNSSPIESNSSLNQVGIATNVLLSIGPLETPKASVEEFSSNIFFEKGPVPFTIRIKNTGTHFIKPKGEIIIKNMFGQNIGKLDLASINILSDSIRAIPNSIYMQELRLKEHSSAKIGNQIDFKHPIALWKESFLLGHYTATLNISLSSEGPMITKTIRFLAFPFQVLIIIIAAIITVIVVKNRLKMHMNKNPKSV